jgi:FkbH-like protein
MINSVQIISNYNTDMIVRRLQKKYSDYFFTTTAYNQWIHFLSFDNNSPRNLFILLDGYFLFFSEENTDPYALSDFYLGLVDKFAAKHTDSIVFISTFDINPMISSNLDRFRIQGVRDYWNNGLLRIAENRVNSVIFDFFNLISNFGRNQLYSSKSLYMQSNRLSISGIDIVSDEIIKHLDMVYKPRKKILVIDLDNTIWGGVLSEAGYLGVDYSSNSIGKIYYDVQNIIKQIKNSGVLIAIVSKNELSEVIDALNSGRFMLTESDFVSICADWNEKSINIKKIVDEINVSLDSVVFLDDNELEREKVKMFLPEVNVADFPSELELLPDLVVKLFNDYFKKNTFTNDDLIRNDSYFAEKKRKTTTSQFKSIDDFIKSLGIKAQLSYAKVEQYTRISQLTKRTNQFNVTNKFYSIADLQEYSNKKNFMLIGNVTDNFGSYGDVFLIMLSIDGNDLKIDNLLMSCRVIGKKIEFSFMKLIESHLANLGFETIKASYIKTRKNTPVESLFDTLNFELIEIDTEGNKIYSKKIRGKSDIDIIYEAEIEIE